MKTTQQYPGGKGGIRTKGQERLGTTPRVNEWTKLRGGGYLANSIRPIRLGLGYLVNSIRFDSIRPKRIQFDLVVGLGGEIPQKMGQK